MPIPFFSLYEKLCGNVNTQQGGHVKPHRNFVDWVNDISFSLFETKFATAWGKAQKNMDDLGRPFLKRINLEVKNGIAKYPPDYGHFSGARIIFRRKDKRVGFLKDLETFDCNGEKIKDADTCRPEFIDEETWQIMQSQKLAEEKLKTVDEVGEDEFGFKTIDPVDDARWGAMMEHRFTKPTLANPKITQYDGGWEVAPRGIKVIVLSYLRKPKLGEYKYTTIPGNPQTGQGDRIVFDPTSQPLEWDSLIINEFMTNLEKKYGKFIREDFIWQTSESDRKQIL